MPCITERGRKVRNELKSGHSPAEITTGINPPTSVSLHHHGKPHRISFRDRVLNLCRSIFFLFTEFSERFPLIEFNPHYVFGVVGRTARAQRIQVFSVSITHQQFQTSFVNIYLAPCRNREQPFLSLLLV